LLEEVTKGGLHFRAYSRVLVALDGSRLSERVLPLSATLARQTGASVELIRVLGIEEKAREVEKYLGNVPLLVEAKPIVAPISISVADTLLDYRDLVPNTLLVMATHGRGGLSEALMGSVATSVIRESYAPVLLYRPTEGVHLPETIETVVVPLDGSEFAEEMLTFACGLARWLGAGVDILQVVEGVDIPAGAAPGDVLDSSYVAGRAHELHLEFGCRVGHEILHGSPSAAICDYTRTRPGSLLAMASHGRQGLAVTVQGSTTRECLRNSHVPVLTYQPLAAN
jgi:nucleotide-binding universal stress UspA family protein